MFWIKLIKKFEDENKFFWLRARWIDKSFLIFISFEFFSFIYFFFFFAGDDGSEIEMRVGLMDLAKYKRKTNGKLSTLTGKVFFFNNFIFLFIHRLLLRWKWGGGTENEKMKMVDDERKWRGKCECYGFLCFSGETFRNCRKQKSQLQDLKAFWRFYSLWQFIMKFKKHLRVIFDILQSKHI